jgi:hypothetical protein
LPTLGGRIQKTILAMMIAKITDNDSGNWWNEFYMVEFVVLEIRRNTVLVKCCSDEGYQPPHDVHEFPKDVVELRHA